MTAATSAPNNPHDRIARLLAQRAAAHTALEQVDAARPSRLAMAFHYRRVQGQVGDRLRRWEPEAFDKLNRVARRAMGSWSRMKGKSRRLAEQGRHLGSEAVDLAAIAEDIGTLDGATLEMMAAAGLFPHALPPDARRPWISNMARIHACERRIAALREENRELGAVSPFADIARV
jgi:hypothetical protein